MAKCGDYLLCIVIDGWCHGWVQGRGIMKKYEVLSCNQVTKINVSIFIKEYILPNDEIKEKKKILMHLL